MILVDSSALNKRLKIVMDDSDAMYDKKQTVSVAVGVLCAE